MNKEDCITQEQWGKGVDWVFNMAHHAFHGKLVEQDSVHTFVACCTASYLYGLGIEAPLQKELQLCSDMSIEVCRLIYKVSTEVNLIVPGIDTRRN